jgi:hypothetical protein
VHAHAQGRQMPWPKRIVHENVKNRTQSR